MSQVARASDAPRVSGSYSHPLNRLAGATAAFCAVVAGCRPEIDVGTWNCGSSAGAIDADGDGSTPFSTAPVDSSWSAGFEDGFCEYDRREGFCYFAPDAAQAIVTSPVLSGDRAAAFSVTFAPGSDGVQSRCVREGLLPLHATYGAWFYLPEAPTAADNWNLMHFRGADGSPPLINLWDVSLRARDDGTFVPFILDAINRSALTPTAVRPVPFGEWFHLEFTWLRASDATGAVALRQDGELVLEVDGLVTDTTQFAQWYVGNLANSLTPSDSTLYVDDVTIRPAP